MARYYVSNVRGNDTTGDGSSATPWKTIGKAIGSSPAITLSGTGDTLYIEPGVYREVVSLGLSPTSGGPLSIVGDFDGAGFALDGYPTPVTGLVDWRGWSSETTGLTTSGCLAAAGKSYVTVQTIKFTGAGSVNPSCIGISGTWSDWTIQDCILIGSQTGPYVIWAVGGAGQTLNLTVRRCEILTNFSGMGLQLTCNTHTSEYSINTLFENCIVWGCSSGVRMTPAGAAAFNPTGLRVQNCCFFLSGSAGVSSQLSASIANTTPLYVYGCYFLFGGAGIVANANTSHFVENGNIFYCPNPRTNVNAGANSVTTACPAINLHDERIGAGALRPFAEPLANTLMTAFGGYGTPPIVDIFNQTRPGTISVGALERDTFSTGTTTTYIFNVEA